MQLERYLMSSATKLLSSLQGYIPSTSLGHVFLRTLAIAVSVIDTSSPQNGTDFNDAIRCPFPHMMAVSFPAFGASIRMSRQLRPQEV